VDGIAILAMFLMVVAFTYNDEVVEMAYAGAGGYGQGCCVAHGR
jgi:hypothetical protein